MHQVVEEIVKHIKKTESIYLIGSTNTDNFQAGSDIDLVVVTNEKADYKKVSEIRYKYPHVDFINLDCNLIDSEISNSPSKYISAINQIILHPRLLYGNNFVEKLKLCKNKIIFNQLHFPLFTIQKIPSGKFIDPVQPTLNKFCSNQLGQKFFCKSREYLSYRSIGTLILTLCSYKLIVNGKFDLRKVGKHWFIEDYLAFCKQDYYYDFINEYNTFSTKIKSYVFDGPSNYFESTGFKKNLFNISLEYYRFLCSSEYNLFSIKANSN
jgi:predicted nucleotidyltransferase